MMAFIHEHLNSMLEPFTHSVNQLHSVVNELVLEMEALPTHEQQLQDHSKMLRVAQADIRATKQRMLDMKEEHSKRVQELEEGLRVANSEISQVKDHAHQVDEEHRESRSFLWNLQQANAAMEVQIKRMEQELAADKTSEQVEKKLEGLQTEIARLSQGHGDVIESNCKFQERLERQKDQWEAFLQNHGLQRRKEELRMKDLRGDISQLQGGLGRTSADLKRQMLTAKSIQEDLSTLARRHEQTMRMQIVQERQQQESNERQAEFLERLHLLKADIQNVMESLGITEGAANLVQTVGELVKSSAQHSSDLESLHQQSRDHAGDLQKLDLRADDADKRADLLKEQDERIEAAFLQRIAELQDTFCHSEQRDQEDFRKEVEARTRGDAECLAKLTAHEKETDRLRDALSQLGVGIEACSNDVRSLEQKIGTTQDQVLNLCGTVDLTQEYWKGLTRGIQETHRKVTLAERLPLKSPRPVADGASQPPRGSLPALTKTVGVWSIA